MFKFPSSIYDCFNMLTEVINYIFILKFHNAYKFLFNFKLSRYFSNFIEKYPPPPFSLIYSTVQPFPSYSHYKILNVKVFFQDVYISSSFYR